MEKEYATNRLAKYASYRGIQRGHSEGQIIYDFVRFLSLFHAYVYVKAPTVTSRGQHLSLQASLLSLQSLI